MNASQRLRRGFVWVGLTLLGLAALGLLAAVALDAGYLRGPLLKILAAYIDRPIRVEGSLRLRILSHSPRLVAERVVIGNPAWTPPGSTATLGRVTVAFAPAHLGQELIIDRLQIDDATLHLLRDTAGHATWQLRNPDRNAPRAMIMIRSLSMMDAHVLLDDAQKHRQFDGTISAHDANGPPGLQRLSIEGKGQLNGKPVNFELSADPLRSASRSRHYNFSFRERSSGSHLVASGFLLQAFDLRSYDATFEASGADLKDMHYLTGARLIDTGSYHLSGHLAWRAYTATYTDLSVKSGQSDLRGSVSIDSAKGQFNVNGDLDSQLLRLADLGSRAAGRDPEAASNPLLFSTAAPDPTALRRGRGTVQYRARSLEAGHTALGTFAAKFTNDHGELTVAPVSARIMGGNLNGRITIDARKEVPVVHLEVRINGMQLAQYPRKKAGPPPIEGALAVKMNLTGRGKSLHDAASTADGTLAASLPGGMVRDSLAELTGIDLRGLGLLLTKDKREVPVRCGIANFQAHDGTLTAKNLVLDTAPVLIAGEGFVHLETETLDLILRGYPKHVRFFQLRSPIVIRGTLKSPSVGIQAHDSKMVLIDPGKAKDADCESLLQ
ncbi:MAG TPA: AsmA family protein [Steroidobacteraceae bacterium]